MGLRINTNTVSLRAQRTLENSRNDLGRAEERLASGQRINRSADDSAGLAIGEKMRADIRSLRQANRNANDGISSFQVAEGGLNTVANILVRFRELAIQSASDTISDTERGFVDKEVQQLKKEVTRVANSTEFNGQKLLNGDDSQTKNLQVGIYAGQGFEYSASELDARTETLKLEGLDFHQKENAQNSLSLIDNAISRISDMRATIGADQNRLMAISRNLETYHENLSAARSRIVDADVAVEASEQTKASILSQAGISVLAQANQNPQQALRLLS